MNLTTRSSCLVFAALLLATAVPASAQFRAPPGSNYPPEQTQGYAPPPPVQGYTPPTYAQPSGAGGYYPYPSYQTPVNGALNGVANLTTATAQYQQQISQAQLQQEDLKRSMMDTRKSVYEEADYEQKKFRQYQQRKEAEGEADKLKRARVNPYPTDIWSGETLNVLLANIENTQTNYGIRGASIPVNPEDLRHINVSTGTTFGSTGLFRDGKPLDWPVPLQEDRFQATCAKIDDVSQQAVRNIVGGKPAAKEIRELQTTIATLKDEVAAATNDQSASDNIGAMRYANQLKEAVRTLADPSASKYLKGTYSAKGNTVPEMVANLSMDGLKFAPATPGDEPYYTALYRSILNYDASLMRMIAPR